MKTKEEIQAQIDIIKGLHLDNYFEHIPKLLNDLEEELQSAKSIQDIERKAFEFALGLTYDNWEDDDFEDWNNYLKSKENESN